jgi:hypothetical protein
MAREANLVRSDRARTQHIGKRVLALCGAAALLSTACGDEGSFAEVVAELVAERSAQIEAEWSAQVDGPLTVSAADLLLVLLASAELVSDEDVALLDGRGEAVRVPLPERSANVAQPQDLMKTGLSRAMPSPDPAPEADPATTSSECREGGCENTGRLARAATAGQVRRQTTSSLTPPDPAPEGPSGVDRTSSNDGRTE